MVGLLEVEADPLVPRLAERLETEPLGCRRVQLDPHRLRDRLVRRLARQRVTEAEPLVRRLGVGHDEVALCEIVEHRGDVDPVVVGQERCDVAGRERQAEDRGAFEDLPGRGSSRSIRAASNAEIVGGIAMPAGCSGSGSRTIAPSSWSIVTISSRKNGLPSATSAIVSSTAGATSDNRRRRASSRLRLGRERFELHRDRPRCPAPRRERVQQLGPRQAEQEDPGIPGPLRDVLEHREQGRRPTARRRRPAGGRRRAIVSRQIRIDQTVSSWVVLRGSRPSARATPAAASAPSG